MNRSMKARADLCNESSSVDWRSAEPKSFSEKLRIRLRTEISDFWQSNVAAFSNLILNQTMVECASERPTYQECSPLSHADQLACAAEVIEDSVANFRRVRECQRAATRQLNAADYALQQLLTGLATAMPALAAETVPQSAPLAVAKPVEAGSEPVAANDDGALAA